MLIAKIIKSNSHLDYVARVLDSLETPHPPTPRDYFFGQFVKIRANEEQDVIGIIYNSQLLNPEYGNYGPRLSTPSELNIVFSPDYLNEQGVLVGILLLGSRTRETTHQGVPRAVLSINSHVESVPDDEILAFHRDARGELQLGYYAHVMTHAGKFAYQALMAILDQLQTLISEPDQARLAVLRKSLTWQEMMGRRQ